ncbi:hypothetical protein BKA62DRAFT_428924 [Auriculariales sp. MPI-PUGE-AT-0066]|nr:hypothetical protein BKA62DRAFT_428924 [Auriculariales sp. MPI-PUGE-AT-0066]
MPNYLWLGTYSSRPALHSSALCLTYDLEDDAYGTIYSVIGRPPHCACAMERSVALRDPMTDRPAFHSRTLLGILADNVLAVLSDYVREACAIVNDAHGRAMHADDWILIFVRSFEDSRFIPTGALVRAHQSLS